MRPLHEREDRALVELSIAGDQQAFAALIGRYEESLAGLIRFQVGDLTAAEDVLQETLIQAWRSLGRLREPDKVHAWLLGVARNRCRDYFKNKARRDRPVAGEQLEHYVNRHGWARDGLKSRAREAVDALEEVPAREREIARLFYLEGFTIAEIAARSRQPEGTVKRQLYEARRHLRESLEISARGRRLKS